jgi:hypothetical protein
MKQVYYDFIFYFQYVKLSKSLSHTHHVKFHRGTQLFFVVFSTLDGLPSVLHFLISEFLFIHRDQSPSYDSSVY